MKLPLLVASTAQESAVIRLFAGTWRIGSGRSEFFQVLVDNELYEDEVVTGPCNVQIKRSSTNPITVYAEKL